MYVNSCIRHTAPINYMNDGNLNKYCQAGTDFGHIGGTHGFCCCFCLFLFFLYLLLLLLLLLCFFLGGGGGWSVVRNKGGGSRACMSIPAYDTQHPLTMRGTSTNTVRAGTDLAISEIPMDSVSIFCVFVFVYFVCLFGGCFWGVVECEGMKRKACDCENLVNLGFSHSFSSCLCYHYLSFLFVRSSVLSFLLSFFLFSFSFSFFLFSFFISSFFLYFYFFIFIFFLLFFLLLSLGVNNIVS